MPCVWNIKCLECFTSHYASQQYPHPRPHPNTPNIPLHTQTHTHTHTNTPDISWTDEFCFNSSPISTAYMHQWIGSALVQIMAYTRHQAIIWINAGLLSMGSLGTHFGEILIKIQKFHSRKCIWKYCLWDGSHLVQGCLFMENVTVIIFWAFDCCIHHLHKKIENHLNTVYILFFFV